MKLLEEWDNEPSRVHAIGLHGYQHRRDHDAGGNLQSELGARGQTKISTARNLCVVVGKSDGRKGTRREHRDPDETVAEVGPQQRGNDDGNHDEQAAHGGRAGFFLVSFGSFFADVLPDLKIAEATDNERTHDQRGEEGGKAGERGAEGYVAENAERRNIMLQLDEQQPVEQSASVPLGTFIDLEKHSPRSHGGVEQASATLCLT